MFRKPATQKGDSISLVLVYLYVVQRIAAQNLKSRISFAGEALFKTVCWLTAPCPLSWQQMPPLIVYSFFCSNQMSLGILWWPSAT
jgi:hypothetical protein